MKERFRHRRMLIVISIACCLAFIPGITACVQDDPKVTVGRDFPMARAGAISKKNNSTKKDVEDLLGPPYKKEKLANRKEKWRYYMRREIIHRIAFLFPRKTEVTENELFVLFDGAFVEDVSTQSSTFTE